MGSVSRKRLKCSPGVSWAVEADGVRLMEVPGGVLRKLNYPEAAVWDFVSRGFSRARMAKLIRHIGGFADEAQASAYVDACLKSWQEQGLVVPGAH